MLKQYIISKSKSIFGFIVFVLVFSLVSVLYDIPLGACLYSIILCGFFGVVFLAYGFYRYVEKARRLENVRYKASIGIDLLPRPKDRIEEDYQEIIRILDKKARLAVSRSDMNKTEMIDYYTMWVHQIKTPIAALRLLLETQQCEDKAEMKMEIFKIEQYVEMVLQYLRLGSEQTDFLIKRQSLDPIIKDAVKKYSSIFIKKKIPLVYENTDAFIVSDEKWIGFVIEQILSNSLKYTNEGKISIYMKADADNVLVIEDTGIGIKEEDIPRVTDKGFTGYNGRTDKKSTGIGLYLCSNILGKLGHSLSVESKVGKGTKVMINLAYKEIKFE